MGHERLNRRPVIVGAGPCGLFAAWQLTLAGYAPLILERGKQVEDRSADVERFWETGILQPDSNVQFGEGGAGTFSDGKLNTVVKDPSGRNRYVLETFVKFGAPSDILYDAKPHIGTDILAKVIKNMRDYLIKHGAEFRFQTCLKDIQIKENALHALVTEDDTVIPADVAILALGHSARDTFTMLHRHQLPMEAKNFAVGFRVEHPQQMIDDVMYGNGKRNALRLPAAPYKVTSNFPNGRGVYSFCMCPGGYVVNASSMKEKTCVNGMSYSGRSGKTQILPLLFRFPLPITEHRIHLMACTFRKHSNIKRISWETERFRSSCLAITGRILQAKDMEILIPRQKGRPALQISEV